MAYTVDGVEVSPIGLGMSALTPFGGNFPTEDAIAVLKAALEAGINYWNGAEAYGTPEYNSLVLLRKYFEKYPEDAGRVVINIKGCCNIGAAKIDCSPEAIRDNVAECLRQLGDRAKINHFELARKDPNVEIEDSVRAMAALVKEGKIGGLGLSEVSAETVRRALAVGKIDTLEVELSIFSTEPLTNGVAKLCAENDITLLAYAPLGHGLLTTKRFEDLPAEGDWRRILPRFHPENLPTNRKLVEAIEAFAAKKGCTPAQLAINWPRALSRRPGMPRIIPIVGTKTASRAADNAKVVDLTDADLDEIDKILAEFPVKGDRYHPQGMQVLDQ